MHVVLGYCNSAEKVAVVKLRNTAELSRIGNIVQWKNMVDVIELLKLV